MRIERDLLRSDQLLAAVDAEGLSVRGLMPPSPLQPVLLARADEVAAWAERRLSGDFEPEPQQIITVRKIRHGVRPVAELFLRDQILYRSIVAAWSGQLSEPVRTSESFRDFEEGPLEDWFASYIVSTDIAAFYQYIDYEILSKELLARTGDADRVDLLVDLLTAITSQRFSLPQQSQPSDVLAEAYIDVLERRLIRQGFDLRRYNDDFRISVSSWREALAAVDSLDREARALGLTLNDSKTVIRKVDTYKDSIERRATLLASIAEEAELDLADARFAPYDPFSLEPVDPDEVQYEAAIRILRRWRDDDPEASVEQAVTQLLPVALGLLTGSPIEDEVLAVCGEILVREQSVTPSVARLLERLPRENEMAALTAIDDLLADNPYLTPWQVSWLAPALSRFSNFASGVEGSTRSAWLKNMWDDLRAPEPVRISVAQPLARHRVLTSRDLLSAFDATSETNRAALAGALGASGLRIGSPKASAIVKDDDLVRWMFEWGSTFA